MKKFLILITAAIFSVASYAGTLRMGTGGPTGNYFSMGNDISSYCAASLPEGVSLEVLNTKGSIDNLLGMSSKKYSAGWVQEDVLQYFAKQQPNKVNKNRLKIIIGGHQEDAHILIPQGWAPKSSTSWRDKLVGFLSTDAPKKGVSLMSLKGQTISSWGGSLVSAKALNAFTGLSANIQEIKPGSLANTPILLVGGQPYGPVETYLKAGYQLLPVDSTTLTSKAPFYKKSTLNYEVNGKLLAVPSFGMRALMIGKSFRNESRNEAMINLATCLSESLLDLADDPETNPNWSSVVELEEQGQTNWSYFSIK